MANICDFDMKIKLTENFGIEQVHEFVNFLNENGVWVSTIINAVRDIKNENLDIVYLHGECRWSVQSSFGDILKEYVLTAGIEMELFSSEVGFELAEHYYYNPTSGTWIDECEDYSCSTEGEDYIHCVWWNVDEDDWEWELV